MKKLGAIIVLLTIVITGVINYPVEAASKTLGQYKKELAEFEADYQNNKLQKDLTQKEISNTRAAIGQAYNEIDKAKNEIVALEKEIADLEVEIENKKEEINEVMSFVQVSSGESAYMEYIFGAKDFTDFIYRTAISEQLSSYNEELIDGFNASIESNKQKTLELVEKQKELAAKQKALEANLSKLNIALAGLSEDSLTIENEIKAIKDTIQVYVDMGCKDDQTFEQCAAGMLPPDTKFLRPLLAGRVSYEYGVRDSYYNDGVHKGIDVTTSDNNTPVYAIANGVVTAVLHQSCGNNIVIIQHKVNGANYTSAYWHMRAVASGIYSGAVVTRDTIIGTMGGRSSEDSCSFGAHVHLVTARGLHSGIGTMHYPSNRFNPREIINFPGVGSGLYWQKRNQAF